jgi:hypothetical protein
MRACDYSKIEDVSYCDNPTGMDFVCHFLVMLTDSIPIFCKPKQASQVTLQFIVRIFVKEGSRRRESGSNTCERCASIRTHLCYKIPMTSEYIGHRYARGHHFSLETREVSELQVRIAGPDFDPSKITW